MNTLEKLSAIKNGSLSASENVEKMLSEIEKNDAEGKEIHALIDVFAEDARKKAKEIDAKIKRGEKVGKLAGLTIAIKNNICIKGKRATCASRMLENYVAPYSASVVERILEEDGIIIASANMDEFACGSDTTKSAFFPTKNPLDTSRVPGGSSGGSGAAVSAGFADLALGSDTGGSIRCPASFCGVVGVKSTYGSVSRYGLIDMGMSLDQIGPFARDVVGAKLLLEVISGKDERDGVCLYDLELNEGSEERSEEERRNLQGIRIGIPEEFFEGVDEQIAGCVRAGIAKLEGAGAEILEVKIPLVKYAVPIYYLQMCAEFSSAMQKYDGFRYGAAADISLPLIPAVSEVRNATLGKEVKRRILLGTYITMKEHRDAWYSKTLKARALLKKEFENAFKKCDLLAGPTMPVLPWKIGEKVENPVEMYAMDILTCSANLAGIPAASIPCGKIGELSVGLQLHADYLGERKIFAAMDVIEE